MQDRFPELMAWLERHPVSYTVLTLAALITLLKALDESSVTGIVYWIMGSLQNRGRLELFTALP